MMARTTVKTIRAIPTTQMYAATLVGWVLWWCVMLSVTGVGRGYGLEVWWGNVSSVDGVDILIQGRRQLVDGI